MSSSEAAGMVTYQATWDAGRDEGYRVGVAERALGTDVDDIMDAVAASIEAEVDACGRLWRDAFIAGLMQAATESLTRTVGCARV